MPNPLLSYIPNYNNQNLITQNNQNELSLKNEIMKLKNDIINLNKINSSLKDENQRLKNENQNLKNQINNNNINLNQYKIKINELNLALTNKINEINNLNNEMKNLQLNNKKDEYVNINKMLIIQIKSIDEKVDMSYACQKDDVFVRIEEKLYNDYPEFKDLNSYFTVNGIKVERSKSMLENNIKNNDKILLNILE